jgi:hypothetical protein
MALGLLEEPRRPPRRAAGPHASGRCGQCPREDIIDAHRKLLSRVHPDKGGTNEAVYEANAARDLLLERLAPRKRA